DVEAELLALDNGRDAGTLDGGNVDEDVRTAIVGLDETIALGGIEEFHGASIHDDFPFNRQRIFPRLAACEAKPLVSILKRKTVMAPLRHFNKYSAGKIDEAYLGSFAGNIKTLSDL